MDRSDRKSATAWGLVGGLAVGAVAVYVVSKYYGRELKPSITDPGSKPKELQMSHVPEQDGDAGQEASKQSTTQEKQDYTKSASLPHAKHTLEDASTSGTTGHTGVEHPPPQGAALSWHQTSEEVTLEACCPGDLRAKDVVCSFTTHSLHVEARGRVIADGELFAPITPDDCWWEFGDTGKASQKEDSKRLVIDMVKAPLPSSRCMWESLYAGGDARRVVQAS